MSATDTAIKQTKAAMAKSVMADVTPEQLLQDAYYGTGGFQDGTYIIPHRRERTTKYDARRECAYFLNYVQPVVNSHVDPVFSHEISRDWGGNGLFGKFYEDTDCDGTDMPHLMKQAGTIAKLKGMCAIVVDNFPAEEQPQTMADVLTDRKMPYAFILEPEEIIGYKVNRFGKLTEFTYYEAEGETENDKAGKKVKITWTPTEWIKTNSDGKEADRNSHGLGRVPVALLLSRKVKKGIIKPPSEFLSIAKTNHRIYNLCSELDELIRNQCFAVLIYPGMQGAGSPKQGQTGAQEITIGTDNILGFPPDATNPPDYIAPPADPAKVIMEQIDRLVKEIYRMAVLSFVTGVAEQKSGVAKQWDFEKTNQVLADFASNCEKCEKDIADIFSRWTKQTISYEVQYPDDFGISDVMAMLDEAIKALELQVGGEFNRQLKRKVAAVYFADLPDDEYDKMMDDIDNMHQDEEMVKGQDKAIDLERKKAEAAAAGADVSKIDAKDKAKAKGKAEEE